ncbi:ATP-binding protein [Desulfoluna spongiiphila]|uniref:ATP-binding protein n=2 Tax=Desulfoluna spongiiphila TaxID=419481 RepID=UPI00125B3BE4|nr:ATP-binding protein [Desulfoluna spongiiphila]VVS91596.1 signal transduction response regulator receiver domain [Desulfoluna spongiiphila]
MGYQRVFTFLALWLLFLGGQAGATEAGKSAPVRQVLVLNSYHPGYVWADSVTEGLRSVFDGRGSSLRVSFEYMDTKRYRPDEIFETLKEVYRLKYEAVRFDVIVAADNNALNFLLQNRHELFPDTPVVFCGINGFDESMIAGHTGYTGVAEDYDLAGTLDLALSMHPSTRYVAYVSGASTSSRINRKRLLEIIPAYEERVGFIDLSLKSLDALKASLGTLPDETLILYLSYYLTPEGVRLTVPESTSLVFNHSGRPVYSPWEYTLGSGVLGGRMLSGRRQAEEAARIALRILSGEPPAEIPVIRHSSIQPIFDYRILRHFSISHNSLPKGSLIRNEPVTVYYQYKYVIWATLIFLVYQSVTIAVLMRIIARRKRAEAREKKLEAQLRQSHKMEAIGTFAGGIAHDFNNILGGITTCTELAVEEVGEEGPAYEDLTHVLKAAQRGKSLVRQILAFSRDKDQEKQPVQMKQLLKECSQLLKSSIPATIDVRLDLQAESGLVLADPTQIHQVIMNLCTNASHAVENQKGLIEITLDSVDLDRNVALIHPDLSPGRYSRLSVRDNGKGIPPDDMDRIFDPFFSTRKERGGTGLGLSMSHGIVKRHQGAITVASHPGRGTIFSVYLPCAHGTEPMKAGAEVPLERKGKERILLVDDDEQMIYGTEKMLCRMGYEVVAHTGSLAALKAVRTDPGGFDLVMTDHMMPYLNGMELANEIRALCPEMPIILYSGYQDGTVDITPGLLERHGILAFMRKPFNRAELAKTIRNVLVA